MSKTRVTVVGAGGFVGAAFCRHLGQAPGIELVAVDRATYAEHRGARSDVTIDCAGNSRKFVAEESPLEDLRLTVEHRLRTLHDFPADLQLHISTVDVYDHLDDPGSTDEEAALALPAPSRYGFHKRLAEQLVRQYAPAWLILRLAGMVGPGLRKNPVFDVVARKPIWIHPDSRYQFLHTDDMARMAWRLVAAGRQGEVFNLCGRGLISPREIAVLAGRALDLSRLPEDTRPRVVDVSVAKLAARFVVPETHATVRGYLASVGASQGLGPLT